jgi:hypothetical protein
MTVILLGANSEAYGQLSTELTEAKKGIRVNRVWISNASSKPVFDFIFLFLLILGMGLSSER